MKSTSHLLARLFISLASLIELWSFQRINIASGSSANSGNNARGVPLISVRAGVLPVVSIPIEAILLISSDESCFSNPLIDSTSESI